MRERILIAGSGGQGILTAGRLLAQAALSSVPYITFFPAYGAEVRGGTCHCQLMFSSAEIGSPIAEQFDSILVMNEQSAARFLPLLDSSGLAVLNSTLCEDRQDKRFIPVPATEIARQLDSPRSANLAMLGAFLAAKPLLPLSEMERMIASFSSAKKNLLEANLAAFAAGARVV